MDDGGGEGSGVGRAGLRPSVTAEFYLPNYRMGKTFAFGSFGKVKVAEHSLTKHKVAIKILNRRRIVEQDMEDKVKREIKILPLLMHPHVIRLYEIVQTPTDIFLVMEYMKSGELFDYIVAKDRLPEGEARRVFQQIVSGVEYCHRHMIAHRDLKPENLLLDSKMNVKIADFGLSNVMRDGQFLKTRCGSPNYAAPEILLSKMYAGPEVDVWSCGVILYALLCGKLPFDDGNLANLYHKIQGGIYTLPSYLSHGARDLIARILVVDPRKRITIPHIRQHPWFRAHLPRYLAITPSDSNQQVKKIDDDVLQAVVQAGFDKDKLLESLRSRVQNQATVAYYLMLDNRRKVSNSYLEEEFQEGRERVAQVGHMDIAQMSTRRPGSLRGLAPGMNHHHDLPPSRNQQRAQVEGNWAFGVQSRASAREVMIEVVNTLLDLEISWKTLGSYCLKCRWVPHVAATRARRSNSDSPMVSGSLGSIPDSPMLLGSVPQHVEELHGGTIGSGDSEAGSEDCQDEEEHNSVKFEVQLYKVKEETYLVDLQRVKGPHILFLDLCASFLTELQFF